MWFPCLSYAVEQIDDDIQSAADDNFDCQY